MTIKYIAELCQNHLGKFDNVKKMVEKCANNGANIIKLQYILSKNLSFRPEFENGFEKKNLKFILKRPYQPEFNRLKKLELKDSTLKKFIRICEENKVEPAITCFARENINRIKDLGFKTIKVASYDCGSFQMIRELTKKFKKIIISTGATYDDEINKTYEMLITKNISFSFLHCVTIYPTPLNFLNLNRIKFLRKFTKNVGYSDHSSSIGKHKNIASMAAIYYGAKIIERHIRILDVAKTKDGPVSIEPEDIKVIINFNKLSKNDQREYLLDLGVNLNKIQGKKIRNLSEQEILNRNYYKGRFASISKKSYRPIYNWEEVEI